MAYSPAVFAQGTLLRIGNSVEGASTTWQTVAEVKSISGPSLKRDTIEVTSHSSTGGYREFINGLKDGGEVSFDINFIPNESTQSVSTGILADFQTGVRRDFKIVFTDSANTEWRFAAVLTSFDTSATVDGALSASITLKIAGAPTLA